MEIYTNAKAADRTVFLEFPDAVTGIDCFVYEDEEELFEIATVTPVVGEGFTAVLPLHLLQHERDLKVHWSVTYVEPSDTLEYTINRITPVEVVTPILSASEIREIDANVFAENAEVHKIEKAVRHIINAYTGQEFGRYIGTLTATGQGGTAMAMPRRLLEITHLNDKTVSDALISIEADGYILRHAPWWAPPIKADYDALHMHTGGVIHNPNNVKLSTFKSSQQYKITGTWGWETIPAAVKEAAKLLVNDYACADSQYRDRYLVSMTAADWRIQFHSGAYQRTGNVRADQLLSDFVVTRGWGVI